MLLAEAGDEELCSGPRGITQAIKHSADGPEHAGRAGESHTKQLQCRVGSLQPPPAGKHQNHGIFCSAKTTGEEETPTFVPLCLHGPACCEQASVTQHTPLTATLPGLGGAQPEVFLGTSPTLGCRAWPREPERKIKQTGPGLGHLLRKYFRA